MKCTRDGDGEDATVLIDTLTPSSTDFLWIYFAIINLAGDSFLWYAWCSDYIIYQRAECGHIFQASEFPEGGAI